MNAPISITAPLDSATLAMVEELARARGITGEQFAADAIRRVAEYDADWRSFVQKGIESAETHGWIGQADMETWLEERIAAHKAR